jgi:ABC-type bacteriocin/lantibiotic exporter with double-glycine peptidase domain
MSLLPVSHQQQRQPADCLAACSAMVLDYLLIPYHYERLLRLLNTRSFGTQFSNLRNLAVLGVAVDVRRGDLEALIASIDTGLPPIVFVNTAHLAHWQQETGHAVVVVGIDERAVYIHDPASDEPAKAITIAEFEAAWIEQDQQYAVLSLE